MTSPNQSSPLLTLPSELLQLILQMLRDHVEWKRNTKWFQKPINELAALQLTCKQLNREIKATAGRQLIPYDQFKRFTDSVPQDPIAQGSYSAKNCRSMTIQFRLGASAQEYAQLARTLSRCASSLQELNLSFTGTDRYGTPVYLHGCAHAPESGRERGLPRDGQTDVLEVMLAMRSLTQLRLLVISNINSQLFNSVFAHMRKLEFLHLTADPRSQVYFNVNVNVYGILVTGPTAHPPVRVMHLSDNSVLNAMALPSHCAKTLRHLTWTIPDPSLGSNMTGAQSFRNTNQLLANLALNAHKLKTLRICIASVVNDNNIRHALTTGIAQLRTLQSLEIHHRPVAPFLGHDTLLHLPRGLKRFYTTDWFVRPRELHTFITETYLSASLAPQVRIPRDPEEDRLARWIPLPPLAPPPHDYCPEYYVSDIKMWIHPTSYSPMYTNEHEAPIGVEITRTCGRRSDMEEGLFLPGIVGEDFRRKDYIPVRGGDLKFVAYDFRNPEHKCRTGGVGETLTQVVLRLNGRLLDRERNRHLAVFNPCDHVPPRRVRETSLDCERETAINSANLDMATLLYALHAADRDHPRDRQAALDELSASPLTDDKRYFGREDEAAAVFRDEDVARPEDLPPLRSAYFEDWDRDDQCHWMCPEGSVPSLMQLDAIDARRAKRARSRMMHDN